MMGQDHNEVRDYIICSHWTDGDVLPLVRIGKKLRKKGNNVTVITHIYYENLVKNNNMKFVPIDTWEEYNTLLHIWEEVSSGTADNSEEEISDEYNSEVKSITRRLREFEKVCNCIKSCDNKPIIVAKGRTSVAAMLAAEKMRVPLVTVMTAPDETDYIIYTNKKYNKWLTDKTNELRSRVGLDEINDWLEWQKKSDISIATWPEWYAHVNSSWNVNVNYTGFICSEEDDVVDDYIDENIMEMLNNQKTPPVLITGGTSKMIYDKFFINSISACEKIGCPTIVVTRYKELLPKDINDNIICCEHLPIDKIMPKCRAVVHHGGMGTSIGALKSGVPQIINAYLLDRPYNAEKLENMKVAIGVAVENWESDYLADVIKDIENRVDMDSCVKYSELLCQSNTLDKIADMISSELYTDISK